MPEEEGAKKEAPVEAPSPGFLSGSKGWVIVITVVVLEAVFFLILLNYKSAPARPDVGDEDVPMESLEEFAVHKYPIGDLNYSIPMQEGTTTTLAMQIEIVLGRTPEERAQPDFEIPKEDWDKFMEALNRMEPYIRDRLNHYISQQSYAQLRSPSGRKKLKEYIQEYINSEMEKLDLNLQKQEITKRRVVDVLIPMFYLQ